MEVLSDDLTLGRQGKFKESLFLQLLYFKCLQLRCAKKWHIGGCSIIQAHSVTLHYHLPLGGSRALLWELGQQQEVLLDAVTQGPGSLLRPALSVTQAAINGPYAPAVHQTLGLSIYLIDCSQQLYDVDMIVIFTSRMRKLTLKGLSFLPKSTYS